MTNGPQTPAPNRTGRKPPRGGPAPLRLAASLGTAARRLRRDERGTTALLTGALASLLVGFAGLVADGGTWYVARRNAQTAADAAAQAATLALLRGQDVAATARDIAARNGFDPANPDTTVRVRAFRRDPNPGMEDAVEVIVEREVPMLFGGVIRLFANQAQATTGETVRIAARAVAQAMTLPGGGGACVLALGENGGMVVQENDLQIGGNTRLNAPQCSLASNTSIRQFGNSRVTAYTMVAAGTVSIGNPANVTLSRPAAAFQPPLRDPFAPEVPGTGIPLPPNNQTCTRTNFSTAKSSTAAITPGVYCGGMTLRGTHDFAPGVYYFQNGGLTVQGSANLTCSTCTPGNGVTFVFTGEPNQICGPENINAQARIDLIGGTPQYPGILMYQDPRAAPGYQFHLNGGANITTRGLFYFPRSDLTINGNFGGETSACKAFIAESITLTGTSTQTIRVDGCGELGVDPAVELPQIRIVRLVE
ncbi:pilus assembly protein TadG-related protein [Elioraea thermophila]|uniref:pilus assembly protein TadG-related protein n=1 Tax=Elioraea thermophila TaxID=2185104 RepID=UPI001300A078|nr:pilus assembly protein TadG-related protein [Elioraea thermophila]